MLVVAVARSTSSGIRAAAIEQDFWGRVLCWFIKIVDRMSEWQAGCDLLLLFFVLLSLNRAE